jgi:3-dehydroquinate dehydratase-1
MTTRSTVKGSDSSPMRRKRETAPGRGRLVAVVASGKDLHAAMRMRHLPDFFELRLDSLCPILDQVENKLKTLRAPLIITARHPREGGANNLSTGARRALLSRFLSRTRFIDIELRSLPALLPLLKLARRKKIQPIISFHDLKSTPPLRTLHAKARQAKHYGAAIFKVATRTDTKAQLMRLVVFFENRETGIAVSAMGMGRLGAASRLLLARNGSALNYVSLGGPQVEGQLRMGSRARLLLR